MQNVLLIATGCAILNLNAGFDVIDVITVGTKRRKYRLQLHWLSQNPPHATDAYILLKKTDKQMCCLSMQSQL